jgi:hypothetical protein
VGRVAVADAGFPWLIDVGAQIAVHGTLLTAVRSSGIIDTPMRPADAVRALLSIVLTGAVAWMPAAPPVHAHRAGIEGRDAAVVHAHPQGPAPRTHDASTAPRAYDAGSGHPLALAGDHGDHLRAMFLDASFERVAKRDLPVAALPVASQLAEPRAAVSIAPDATARAHAPPLLRWVTRGPPSLS